MYLVTQVEGGIHINARAEELKEISKRYFDKKSDNYLDTWDGRYCQSMYDGVLQELDRQPFESMLDVGCGPGNMLAMVIDKYPGVRACGVDISANMIHKAAGLVGDRARLLVGDAEALPWQDDSFDLVICSGSFHHYPDPLKALKEMRRTLKSAGRLIIADPWWPSPLRYLINLYLQSSLNFQGDVRIYPGTEMRRMLASCGFTSIERSIRGRKYTLCTAKAGK